MDDSIKEWIKFSNMDLTTARHLYETLYPQPL
jgi:hypothetical protein